VDPGDSFPGGKAAGAWVFSCIIIFICRVSQKSLYWNVQVSVIILTCSSQLLCYWCICWISM
jgi:hypothetical protein